MTAPQATPETDPVPAPSGPGFFRRTGRTLTLVTAWLFVLLLLFAAMVFLLYLFTPWQQTLKDVLTARLRTEIAARTGAENVDLTLTDITLTQAQVENLSLGGEGGLSLGAITLSYDPRTLWDARRIGGVTVTAPVVTALQTPDGWRLKGLPLPAETKTEAAPTSTLFTPDTYANLPLDTLTLDNGTLLLEGDTLKGRANFTAAADFASPALQLALTAPALTLGKTALQASKFDLDAELDPESATWSGPWTLQDLDPGLTFGDPVPVLSGKGRAAVTTDKAVFSGTLTDSAKLWTAAFTAALPLDGKPGTLTLTSAALPWMGGSLSLAEPLTVPLQGRKTLRAHIRAESLSIDRLLQTATGSRVTATGNVSGTLPVILHPDGTLDIGTGLLEAAGEGRLTMPPEALPGDNPQIGLLRDVLSDFHYTNLSVEAAKDEAGKPVLTLRLSGNNPAVQDGREVKLNVNLTGDILSLIQQNMVLMTDPRKLLRQE